MSHRTECKARKALL